MQKKQDNPARAQRTPTASTRTVSRYRGARNDTRAGTGPAPADIADAVGFLMGARAVTGQVLFVDSGERFLARSRDVLFETERL